MSWNFPSCGNAGPEGLGNGALEMFKGDPLKALAREICQNSLDACRDESKPVRVEFKLYEIPFSKFPGMDELERILIKCEKYWEQDVNKKTKSFFQNARESLKTGKLKVLRISDYNTKGLLGAFDTKNVFNSWVGLVKSSAMSVKNSENAGGSYGIGKNAPFVNSYIQTVFYRTFSEDDVKAAQGVAHLASFIDDSCPEKEKLKRSLGFYADRDDMPFESLAELDSICVRSEYGTDLFIPAFKVENDWVQRMSAEIMDNFLMSVYYGKLEVEIGANGSEGQLITRDSMYEIIARYGKYIKEAKGFATVLKTKDGVEEVERDFYGMGNLKLRLLFAKKDLNQKILVVRNSGMKIAEIPKLPRQISFSGILELEGEDLNGYFRGMETPQHDKWEPKRHPDDPEGAKQKKAELENWVINIIEKKVMENVADEVEIETFEFFNGAHDSDKNEEGDSMNEKNVTYEFADIQRRTRDYSSSSNSGKTRTRGFVDPEGDVSGHRHRTGQNGGNATGRSAFVNPLGPDSVYTGRRKVAYKARVVKANEANDVLFISSAEDIKDALVELVTVGENGKSMPIDVINAECNEANVYCKNGKLYIANLESDKKIKIKIQLGEKQNFALGVNVYGNKE